MGSMRGRVRRLEKRIQPPTPRDEAAEIRRALLRATMDEIAALKRSRAVHSRRTEPEDIPGQYLAKPYTFGQLVDLAITRVWGREDLDEDLMEPWMEAFKALLARKGVDLEAIEDYPGRIRNKLRRLENA